ncbi:hypothetical protein B0J14DRAFT_609124 [Halenospora varia]|nr:hypothetical protein B0J14DRAFT_609124 [Halenospora varia]
MATASTKEETQDSSPTTIDSTNNKPISNMGRFFTVPPEIRLMIFHHLIDMNDEPIAQRRFALPPRKFAILEACRELYIEFSAELYHRQTLEITLNPSFNFIQFLVKIAHTRIKTTWDIDTHKEHSSRHREAFRNFSFHRLEKIKIIIKGADPLDPGQICCLRSKTLGLIDLLTSTASLPKIEIQFLDHGEGRWCYGDGRDQSSLFDWESVALGIDFSSDIFPKDFKSILLPFRKLRNVPTVSIEVSDKAFQNQKQDDINDTVKLMTSDYAFGYFHGLDDYWANGYSETDGHLGFELDSHHLDFDRALDLLPGKTANMLRLDRFATWFVDGSNWKEATYVKAYERAWAHLKECERLNNPKTLLHRFQMMMALNPGSANNRRMREQLHVPPDQRKDDWPLRHGISYSTEFIAYITQIHELGVVDMEYEPQSYFVKKWLKEDNCASENAWWLSYPDGIPPLEPWGFNEFVKKYMPPLDRKLEEDLRERFDMV